MSWQNKRYKFIGKLTLAIGIFLLSINILGLFMNNDYRDELRDKKQIVSYKETLVQMDQAYNELGATQSFLEKSVKIYENGILYEWIEEYTKIPITDNYILWGLSFFDKVFYKLGVTPIENLFSVFESSKYERGLGRGFGICSQNSIGLADLLYKRYGIETYMIGLSGHVVFEAHLKNKSRYVLDPSVGVIIPFSLSEAENSPMYLKKIYASTQFPELAQKYDKDGNVYSNIIGGGGTSYNVI